jgi:hypothetical protein
LSTPTVTLSTGQSLAVQPVPPFALAEIERRYAAPHDTLASEDPAARASREKLTREVAWLLALPDVVTPEDWQFPRALRYAGIEPRDGDEGRLLDYIEYALLVTPGDIQAVQAVMYGAALTEDDIGAAEAVFPADCGRTPPFTYPGAAG